MVAALVSSQGTLVSLSAAGRDAPTLQAASVPVAPVPVDAACGVALSRGSAGLRATRRTALFHARQEVFNAIVLVMDTHSGWRALPSTFPPWQTVYAQLRQMAQEWYLGTHMVRA